MMMKTNTVYLHIFPNNKMYCGITSKKPERRWQRGDGYSSQPHMFRAIKKYGWDNIIHHVVIDGVSNETAWELEKRIIKTYNLTNTNFGYNKSFGGEEPGKYIPVYMFDLSGKLLMEFNSGTEAATYLGCAQASISNACCGKLHTVCGHIFSFDKTINLSDYKPGKKRCMGILNGEERIFSSVREACGFYDITSSGASYILKNGTTSRKGLQLFYL